MSMRRGNRGLRLRPVNSVKHIVETNGNVLAGTASVTDVINTVDAPIFTNTVNNHVGSNVRAIYLRVEVVAKIGAGGIDNIYMGVMKNPANEISIPNLDVIGGTDKRKFFIHQEMLMTGQTGGNPGAANIPRTMFKGVILIPRHYQRNGIDDKLQVILQHCTGEATQQTGFCIECIYKEFY